MKKLEYTIDIAASPKKVAGTMLQHDSYKEWTNVSWPGSDYAGEWKQGENLRFFAAGQGGTLATIVEFKPNELISAEHIAVINKDGSEDRDSEIAKGWVGTTETYRFIEKNGTTELKVEISTFPDWVDMFNDGWPAALAKLKEICEN